jgi:photosystem II stability/assembly factor-like uncharacterized protein
MWVGSVGGGVWKTLNGGGSWAPLYDFMGNLAVTTLAIGPIKPKVTIYAGTGEGFWNGDALRGAGIFKSEDSGVTWQQLKNTATADFFYVNRLALSPNYKTLLAATRTGLFRSADGGATWKKQLAVPANPEVLDVKFHPKDGQLCVAAGRGGMAFYSGDGGATWKAAKGLPAVPGFGGRVELTYALANPKTVYASVDNNSGEVYASADGGQNYQLRNTGTNYLGSQGWYDNTIWAGDPKNEKLVVVGGLDLYRSTDGGNKFNQISYWFKAPASPHADHHVIVAHPQYNGTTNRVVFFGNDGGLYRAKDVLTANDVNGWQELNNNLGITQFYGAAANPATGTFVGGAQDNGTLRFTKASGPEKWSSMFGGDGGYCAADPTDPNFFYGEYVYLQIHRSTDGGASSEYIWNGIEDAGKGPDLANFIAPFLLDPNNPNTLLAGGASLWRSTNVKAKTPQWANIKPSVQSPISAIAVAKGKPNIIWVGHNDGRVYRTDKGTNATLAPADWTQVGQGKLPPRFCQRITTDPVFPNVVYVTFGGYANNNVWKTEDGGATWSGIGGKLPDVPVRGLAVHPKNTKFVYAGTEVGVFASEDGGKTWSPTNEGPTNCSVDDLFFLDTRLVAVTHGRGLFIINVVLP